MKAPDRSKAGRRAALALSLSCLTLAAGCGGGEDDPFGGVFRIPASPGGSGMFGSYYMASITGEWRNAAASIRNNLARYRNQNGSFTISGQNVFANPLFSSRVDYAHAVGLTGKGQVIAVVDEGFRRTHEAFAGKANSVTGAPPITDHGTMVASIAAGDSRSMIGVAPGADIAFGWYGTEQSLTAAANNARARNAVVQNNSWGFANSPVGTDSFNAVFGSAEGGAWLEALEAYAQRGVVVFAATNDTGATTSGLMEALPVLRPDLERAWIAVGNAVPVFDDSGVSSVALRASAPCHEAARWCIVADGFWWAATAASNRSYGDGVGTSFAAPQVSGAIALLAEAFPALTPHQLRARLLASADNTFTGFVPAGTVDLIEGPGVFDHAYSSEFGHGFLDIRAALLPIGTTTVATAHGGAVETAAFGFSTGGAIGDAVARSLEGIDLTVTDALGGGFDVAAKTFARAAEPQPLAAAVAARAFAKDYGAARRAAAGRLAEAFASHDGQTLEVRSADGQASAAVLLGGGESYGIAVSRRLAEGEVNLDLGMKLARDDGTLLGFSDAAGAEGAGMAALTLGLSHDTGAGGFFALSAEFGVADLAAPVALSSVSSARFDSVSLDLGSRGVFARGDRLALGVSLPVAVSSGSAEMTVPVSLGGGRTEIRSLGIDLEPEERQVDVSLSYQVPVGDNAEMLFELVHADNYGNRAGLSDNAAVIGVQWRF